MVEVQDNCIQTNIIVDYIKRRIALNKNFICFVVGDTGSGKSYAALYLAQRLDPNFSTDRIVLSASEFISLVDSNTLSKGAVIVIDEAGLSWQTRDSMSTKNKLLSGILQTFRNRNYICFFTVPDLSFIDKQAKRLAHMILETKRIDYKKRTCILKSKIMSTDRVGGKAYAMYPIFPINGVPTRITTIVVNLPSDELLKDYEDKKTAHLNAEYAEYKKTIQEMGKHKERLLKLLDKIANMKQ